MPTTQFSKVIEHIHTMAARHRAPAPSDRDLLDHFSATHDEAAFATLVSRHGPMVFRVCRRVLSHEQDAEDAFQAVFLVLVQNSSSLRKREALAEWLHGVAYRTAMKLKRTAARRRNHEAALQAQVPASMPSPSWSDVQLVLDEEIQRLPKSFRAAFAVCVLEGKTGRQAASDLGIPAGTVSSRLTWARKRLQQRLSLRGIELSALLSALALADGVGNAMPAHLASVKALAGLIAAANGTTMGSIAPHVAALAKGMSRALFLTKAKIVAGLLLAAGLFAAGGAVARQANHAGPTTPPAQVPSPPLKAPGLKADETPAVAKDNDAQRSVTYSGKVLDLDGKPVAGAKIYLLYYTPKELPVPLRATSGTDGNFSFEVAKASLDKSASIQPWNEAILVARSDGYGLGLPNFDSASLLANYTARKLGKASETLHLTRDDAPIAGRLLDIEGKPCKGVVVRVVGLQAPMKGDLTGFLHGVKETKTLFPNVREHLIGFENWIGRDLGALFPPAITGGDGRFVLQGIGRERLVELRCDGSAVTTTQIRVVTRAGSALEVTSGWNTGFGENPSPIHGSSFEMVLHPSKPIIGVILDKDTKRPLAGAVVTGSHPQRTKLNIGPSLIQVHTIADQQGRYKLTGLPKSSGNVVRAAPPEDQPYLMLERTLDDTPGLEPIQADFALMRGVWISGRVFDKTTGEPVHSRINYAPFNDNPNTKAARGLTFDRQVQTQADNGVFRFVGLPGRGVIGATPYNDHYPRLDGNDIKRARKEGFPFIIASNYSGLIEVDSGKDVASLTADIPLEQGGTLSGTILDPEGKPLAGALVSGPKGHLAWEQLPLATPDFTLENLRTGKPRLVQFAHLARNLAGFLVIKGDEKGPLTVKLGPAGAIKGRLVTKDGDPMTNGEILGFQDATAQPGESPFDPTRGYFPRGIRPDKEGKFQINGLAPGLKYKPGLLLGAYALDFEGKASGLLSVNPGETKDLGDVLVHPNK